jgi:hypothetical protein
VGQRDPEMRSSKKSNQWYFGMKAHIGALRIIVEGVSLSKMIGLMGNQVARPR